MESQALYRPVFMSNGQIPPSKWDESFMILVELNISEANWDREGRQLAELLKDRRPFLIQLTRGMNAAQDKSAAQIADFITIFLMGVTYECSSSGPILFIRGIGRDEKLVEDLTNALKLQGFERITYLGISGVAEQRGVEVLLIGNESSIIELVTGEGPILRILNKYILFTGKDLEASMRLEEETKRNLMGLLNNNQGLKAVVDELLISRKRVNQLEREKSIQDRKLTIAESFVEVARNKYKDDYEELFRYYHAEYEVLPIWFKRFGHLIKVMIGKRSLKSLFNDRDIKSRK